MLVEQDVFNKKQFLELFQKRFFSFCEKSPLFIRFTILEDRVLVYDLSVNAENKPFEHMFDFSKSEKENIKTIKNKLVEENYPIIVVNKSSERSLSVLEIQELMFKNRMSFAEASSKKNVINRVEKYRVEKVLNSDNKVIIRDLQNNEVWIYEVKIPVVIFVRELFLDSEKSAEVFINKCRKYKRVVDRQEA